MEINKQNKLFGTEQDALRQEEEQEKWQKTYGEKLPDVIEKMDMLLADGSKEAWMQLKSMFLPGELFEHYKQTDVYATMYLVMCIWERESEEGSSQNILRQGGTVAELTDYLFQLKMILYRLDFEIGNETTEEFLSFIRIHDTSMATLETMLTTSVMRSLKLALKLENIFETSGLKGYEIYLLLFIEKHWTGNYRVRKKLSSYGIRCSSDIKEIAGNDMEIVIPLQELMWKLLYKDNDSEKEIAKYLKKNPITNESWKTLLGLDGVKEIEYYLLLVNVLLEERVFDKAVIVLEFVIEKKPEYEPAVYLLEKIRQSVCETENGL